MVTVDMATLSLIASAVIPFITALLTKLQASSGVKAFLSVLLAGVTAVVSNLLDLGGVANGRDMLYVFLFVALGQGAAHQGVLKPLGLTPGLQRATPEFGIGQGA